MPAKPKTVQEYIASFPPDVQVILEKLRSTIEKAIPDADQVISYHMACFKMNGRYVVYFAGHKSHVGLYPVPEGLEEFEKDFAKYKTSGKGTIQLPYDKPLPTSLITRIVKYMVKKNEEITKAKPSEKKSLSGKTPNKKAPAKKRSVKLKQPKG